MRSRTGGMIRRRIGVAGALAVAACHDDSRPANAGGDTVGVATDVEPASASGLGSDDGTTDDLPEPDDAGSGAGDTSMGSPGCSNGQCGTCQTDCFGAECIDGLCQPIALHDWSGYGSRYSREFGWIGDAAIIRAGLCPVDDGLPTLSGWELHQVALDGTVGIFAEPDDGSTSTAPFVGDGDFVYYQRYSAQSGSHALARRDRVTGEDTLVRAVGDFGIVSFVRAPSDFYALLVDLYDMQLVRIAADGSQMETLLAAEYVTDNASVVQPSVILHGDAIAFWWNYAPMGSFEQVAYPADIWTLPLAGGEPTPLVSGVSQITSLASDGERVYYSANGTYNEYHGPEHDGGVYAVGPTGDVETLASDLVGVGEVAVDDTHVYWTAANSLYRRAKQGGATEVLPAYPAGRGVVLTEDSILVAVRHDHTSCGVPFTGFADYFEASLVRLGK